MSALFVYLTPPLLKRVGFHHHLGGFCFCFQGFHRPCVHCPFMLPLHPSHHRGSRSAMSPLSLSLHMGLGIMALVFPVMLRAPPVSAFMVLLQFGQRSRPLCFLMPSTGRSDICLKSCIRLLLQPPSRILPSSL